MSPNQTSELGTAIQEVTEKAQILVREEIELAKAELTVKVSKLLKGVAVGAVAGVFAVIGLLFLVHSAAWGIWELVGFDGPWLGYLIVAVLLFLLGGLAGFLASRFVKRGVPPAPQMAIEEAKLIKETVTSPPPIQATHTSTERRS
jgi:hypothetical protein